jgi:RNA polymerase sigma-70 factor (ECF subfamily)
VQRLLNEKPAPPGDESALFDTEYRRQLFRWAAEQIRGEFRETTWDAFWRTCVDGCEIKQVAEQLDVSVGAVYIARSRVLARLRERVSQIEREV